QHLVDALARATGIAVENARLSHESRSHILELEDRNQALRTLGEIGALVLESLDSSAVVDVVLDRALAVGPFDMGLIHLLRDNRVEPVAARGLRDPDHAESYLARR